MKRFVVTMALIGALSFTALGGDMHGTDSPAPGPSPTPQGMRSASVELKTPTPGDVHPGDSVQPSIEDMLNALLSVFGLVF